MLADIYMKAPAKINIGLKVLSKRADGFHGIESIFQSISLYDELQVSTTNNSRQCLIHCNDMDLPEKNTISNTYNAFCELTGLKFGIDVFLKKRIPSGGGLGGGSSDAASLLKALEKIAEIKLPFSVKETIAEKIGSDVFFFIHCCKTKNESAIITGRGEIVKKIKSRTDLHFIVIFSEVFCSTKECYSLVDRDFVIGKSFSYPLLNELESIYNQPVIGWNFVNSFTPVIVEKYPVIGQALLDLKEAGAPFADMSGSGSSVFGVFESEESAKKALGIIAQNWKKCIMV